MWNIILKNTVFYEFKRITSETWRSIMPLPLIPIALAAFGISYLVNQLIQLRRTNQSEAKIKAIEEELKKRGINIEEEIKKKEAKGRKK